jgi:hypothetical protein
MLLSWVIISYFGGIKLLFEARKESEEKDFIILFLVLSFITV